MSEIIEGELVEEESHELVLAQKAGNLFGVDAPAQIVEQASEYATVLADVVNKRELFKMIRGNKHVKVEGWTLLGSMLGVFPVLEGDPERVDFDGVTGWKATVTAQTRSGEVVGRASALCLRSEERWRKADEYAICSMAQTRATSKSLKAPLGFIMQLAGFNPTPEAELSTDDPPSTPSAPRTPPAEPLADARQHARHNLLLQKLEASHPRPEGSPNWTDLARAWVLETFGKQSRSQLTSDEMDRLIAWTILRQGEAEAADQDEAEAERIEFKAPEGASSE